MALISVETIPQEFWSDALPTAGTFRVGDRVKINAPAPAPGTVVEYVCTTAGVAGSTAVFQAAVVIGQRTANSTQLNSITNAVNTANKLGGTMVFNTTTNRPVWATGFAASAAWVHADGTTAHTPV